MFGPSSSVFIPLICLLFSSCSTKRSQPPKPSIDRLAEADLTKRPLNLYIVANGKHAVIEKKAVDIDGNNLEYTVSDPPFLIKTRGVIVILTSNPKQYTADRPSLHQMLAASGHKTILLDLESTKASISAIIEKVAASEEFSKYSILADSSVQSQVAGYISTNKDKIESAILLGFKQSSINEITAFSGPVLAISDTENTDVSEFSNAKVLVLPHIKDFSKDAVMHILQNYLDLLHIR